MVTNLRSDDGNERGASLGMSASSVAVVVVIGVVIDLLLLLSFVPVSSYVIERRESLSIQVRN